MYDQFLAVGTRIAAISIDSPEQQAAMVEKLDLPFPMLSDPDRSLAIEPFDVVDPKDHRNLSRPALVLLTPTGEEAFRFVSRDFADRLPEADVLEHARQLGLGEVTQSAIEVGPAEASPGAMPLEGLPYYLRGARFAALAMGLRHKDLGDAIKEDSKAYVAEMDRYFEAVQELRARLNDS